MVSLRYRRVGGPPTAPLVTLETRMTSAVLRIIVATLWGNETKASDVYSAVGLRRSPPLPLAPAADAVYLRRAACDGHRNRAGRRGQAPDVPCLPTSGLLPPASVGHEPPAAKAQGSSGRAWAQSPGRTPCPPTAAAGMHGRGKATVHAQRDVRVHGPVHASGTAQQMRTSTIRKCSSSEACSRRPRTVPLGA